MSRITIICLCIASAISEPAAAQQVTGDVVAAGFGATNTAGRVARKGQWIPILCNLRAQLDHFQGELSCEAVDLDGDRVAFNAPLVLTKGGNKRVWLYVSSPGDPPNEIAVFSKDGAPIIRIDVPEIQYIGNDTVLVLDISDRAAGFDLQTRGIFTGEALNDRKYYHNIVVSRMAARQLPDEWWGLEAVNVIVWDKPNPADLNVAQMAALIAWVRNGGQLVVGLGEAWSLVRASPLAEILPLEGTQPVGTTQRLNNVLPAGVFPRSSLEFSDPIAICTAQRVRGTTIAHARLPLRRKPVELIVSESVGSGRVVTITTGIADLMKMEPKLTPKERLPFLKVCFDLNEMDPKWLELEEQTFLGEQKRPLSGAITHAIGFVRRGQMLRIAAIGFVVLYILLSTFATWWWLKKRSLTQMSWTAFAACAVAASFLSLATVGMSRGFSRVHAVTVYDMQADSKQASGPCWFGYRSPTRDRVELTLPGGQNYLRALSRADQPHYATPERYTAYASQARLSDTLMRASLKQFEGFWVGELDGVVRAQLQVERPTGHISPQSWIANELPVNIIGGWLLYMDPRLDSAQNKPAGYEPKDDNNPAQDKLPAQNVLLVRIPPLPVSGRTDQPLGAREAKAANDGMLQWQANKRGPKPDLATLRDGQLGWMRTLGSIVFATADQQFQDAVMLASTRNLHLNLNKSLKGMEANIGTEGLIDMDVTHWLSKDQGVLILFSDEPGPATLVRDGAEMKSKSGYSVYRVRVPITPQGNPPPARADQPGDQP